MLFRASDGRAADPRRCAPALTCEFGRLAQLVERVISTANVDEVFGSIPKSSTHRFLDAARLMCTQSKPVGRLSVSPQRWRGEMIANQEECHTELLLLSQAAVGSSAGGGWATACQDFSGSVTKTLQHEGAVSVVSPSS